jgi:hypothetical protein
MSGWVSTHPAAAAAAVDRRIDPVNEARLWEFGCRRCGDTIGVYEPLALVHEGRARITSRAVEPGLPPAGIYFHRDCYERSREYVDANLRRSAWRRGAGGAPPP